jgi:hypothetical protein
MIRYGRNLEGQQAEHLGNAKAFAAVPELLESYKKSRQLHDILVESNIDGDIKDLFWDELLELSKAIKKLEDRHGE